eukprot:scaffold122756_cov66-Phaeocystis_antarctica.AAC.1
MRNTGRQVHDETLPRASTGRQREAQRLAVRSLEDDLPDAQHAIRDGQLDPVGCCWVRLTHDQLRCWRRGPELRSLRCRSSLFEPSSHRRASPSRPCPGTSPALRWSGPRARTAAAPGRTRGRGS